MSDCGADDLANELVTSLLEGHNFSIENPDVSGPEFEIPDIPPIGDGVTRLTNEDLTERQVDGSGTFDALMAGFNAHLKQEFEKGRITGDQYTKTYIALTEGAMSNAVQFLLGRDASYWQAVTAQQQAYAAQAAIIQARVQLEIEKLKLKALQLEMHNQQATFALTKMKVASESIAFCIAQFQHEQLLPAQLAMTNEQREAQRAQTLDTRSDGTPVVGVLGKQKDLYSQQITSYKRDSEVKAAKIFTDAWITMKTIDEGLLPPTGFNNQSLNTILSALKLNNNLSG